MSDVLKPEELLFREYDQQYEQYRHLDNLRERYAAFYIAFVTAAFVVFIKDGLSDHQKQLILAFLFIIGIFVLSIAISMRITQRLTADHLMEIRKELIRMLPTVEETDKRNKMGVCNTYLMSTYKPHEKDTHEKDTHKKNKCFQCGWLWNESAIQLIWLLMFVNSFIGIYLFNLLDEIQYISWAHLILSVAYMLLFYGIFKSELDFGFNRKLLLPIILVLTLVIGYIAIHFNVKYWLFWQFVFLTLITGQWLFFYWRFKWEFGSKKQDDRQNEISNYLQDVCEFSDNKFNKSN